MKLTQKEVDKLPPVDKPTKIFDSELKGFGVRIMPKSGRAERGTRTWIVEYRPGAGGRSVSKRLLSLGSTTVLDANEARGMAKDVLAKVRFGEDPALARGIDRRSATVTDLAEAYKKEAGVGRKDRTKELYESYWRLWVIPEIGTMKAKDVRRSDIARVHRKCGATPKEGGAGHPITANRVVTLLAHFYSWAGKHGSVPEGYNPAKAVERYRESARERYLTTDELQRLGAALVEAETDGIPWVEDPDKPRSKHAPKNAENRRTRITPHAAAAIRLLLFTGARLREILHLRWSEVDLERGLLLLPDSKTGRKTIVLGSAALQVIADLDKTSDFVIAGLKVKPKTRDVGIGHNRPPADETPADKPRADLQRPWALVSQRAGLAGLRLHDLRHTFASYGAAGGLGLPVIGGLLGHRDAKTTQRYAHLGNDPLRRASESISSDIAKALSRESKREKDSAANG